MSARGVSLLTSVGLAAACLSGPSPDSVRPVAGWPYAGGDPGNARWSALREIHRDNVDQLEVVWSYRHGDYYDPGPRRGRDDRSGTAFEGSPILVDGRLVFATPYARVIALDPETGEDADGDEDKGTPFRDLLSRSPETKSLFGIRLF